jgi:hypothetical protein
MMGEAIALLTLLLVQAGAAPPAGDPLDAYLALTRVEPRCRQTADSTEILVCARRGADRHRVPFLVATPGDPRQTMPREETDRLLARNAPCAERNAMSHVGCGMVGITLSTNLGTGAVERERPLAQ